MLIFDAVAASGGFTAAAGRLAVASIRAWASN